MTATAEFCRPQRVDAIGEGVRPISIMADAVERAALATRFALLGVDLLEAEFTVTRDAAGIVARGRVRAHVVQACVVTGDALPVAVDEPVALRFVPHHAVDGDEEIELSHDALDTVDYDGGVIDLGEVAAETMALALDPFPRAPGADAALRQAGVLSEAEAGPFAALAALKGQLKPDA